jgi:protein-tyrosine phosphatase
MVMDTSEILPHIFVGSCPRNTADIDCLRRDIGVTAVLNVQTQEDFDYWDIDWGRMVAHYAQSGAEVRHVPVRDFDREALRRELPNCVQALEELVRDGHVVYVHCSAGVNRSPSTVIAYLHWAEGWDLEQAVRHVTKSRSCDPYVEAIRLATEDRLRGREP